MAFPRDTMDAKVAFYGDPRGPDGVNQTWYAANMTRVTPPFRMTYAGKAIKTIAIHKKCAASLKAALDEIWSECLHDQATVEKYSLHEFGGSFNYRLIRGRSALSNHSFGIAIDIAPTGNALGVTKGKMPAFAVAAFKRQGWKWGGDYAGRKDWMHFEAVSALGKAAPAVAPAAVLAEPDVEEPAIAEPDDLAAKPAAVPSIDIETVQRKLKERGYHNVGLIDGKWGGATAGAIAAFKNDRHLSGEPVIDDALKAELDAAEAEDWTRPIARARAEATPDQLAPKLPEVAAAKDAGWWAKLQAWGAGVGATIWGLGDYIRRAIDQVTPIREFLPDISMGVVVAGVLVVSFLIWRKTSSAAAASTQAYNEGART